jgi:hypothetical protein
MLPSRATPQFSKLYKDFELMVLPGEVNLRDPLVGPFHHYRKKKKKKNQKKNGAKKGN